MPQSVILLSDIPGLGQVGDKRSVKDGYARNYLYPQHLAVRVRPVRRYEQQPALGMGKFSALERDPLGIEEEAAGFGTRRATFLSLARQRPYNHDQDGKKAAHDCYLHGREVYDVQGA